MNVQARGIHKKSYIVIIQSLLVALFMDVKCLNRIISSSNSEEEGGVLGVMYIGIFGLLLLTSLFDKKKIHIGLYPILILFYIIASYYITVSFLGDPYSTLPHITVFTVCSFLLPFIASVDVKLTIKTLMILPVIGLFRLSQIFKFVTDYNEYISMGLSYAFYTPIVATIIYLFCFYRRETKKQRRLMFVVALVDLLYLFEIFKYGSRGPLVLLLMLLTFLLTIRNVEKGIVVKKSRLLLFGLLVLFLLFFYDSVFLMLDSLFNKIGIHSHMLEKFVQLASMGDVGNGRDVIYDLTWKGIINSPIIGNGFDLFYYNTRYVYPHNFILQILYDGGIFLFFLILVPAFRNLVCIYKKCNISEYALLCLLLFVGPGAGLFSGNLWRNSLLWLFLGFTFSKSFISKKLNYE